MFDFSTYLPPVWPESLKPRGEGTFEKESFETWWGRNSDQLRHLHPQLAEQWIHRHWLHSEFSFLPLDSLTWDLRSIPGTEILETVERELARQLDPEFDYEVFQGRHGEKKHATARALDNGTWDYPIIVLATPNGWLTRRGSFPDARLMLVEGHQRHRYLNALHAKGIPPAGPHDVFVIKSPVAE